MQQIKKALKTIVSYKLLLKLVIWSLGQQKFWAYNLPDGESMKDTEEEQL